MTKLKIPRVKETGEKAETTIYNNRIILVFESIINYQITTNPFFTILKPKQL